MIDFEKGLVTVEGPHMVPWTVTDMTQCRFSLRKAVLAGGTTYAAPPMQVYNQSAK